MRYGGCGFAALGLFAVGWAIALDKLFKFRANALRPAFLEVLACESLSPWESVEAGVRQFQARLVAVRS
jgi:hypothetical protein